MVLTTLHVDRSRRLACADSSFDTYMNLPSGVRSNDSGSRPLGRIRVNESVVTSIAAIPSAFRSAGGGAASRALGGALGEPLKATYSVFPSGARRMPRGLL